MVDMLDPGYEKMNGPWHRKRLVLSEHRRPDNQGLARKLTQTMMCKSFRWEYDLFGSLMTFATAAGTATSQSKINCHASD